MKLLRFVRGFLPEDSLGGAAVLILQAGAVLQSLQAAATLPFIISNLIAHSLSKDCPADPGQSFLYALMSAGVNGDKVYYDAVLVCFLLLALAALTHAFGDGVLQDLHVLMVVKSVA